MARRQLESLFLLFLAFLFFVSTVDAISADEAVVADETNEKGHLPNANAHHDHQKVKTEASKGLDEFVASPGMWLKAQDKMSRNIALQRFVDWLRDEGSTFAAIALDAEGTITDEREGIRVEEDLAEDSVLATVPLWTLLSTTTPHEDLPPDTPYCDLTRRWDHLLLKQLFTEPGGTGSEEEKAKAFIHPSRGAKVLLTLCLIHEMKKEGGSFWQPFLDTLPRTFNQPITWSDDALAALQASPLAGAVADARAQLSQDYTIMTRNIFTHPAQGFTREQFYWAMLVVASRIQELQLPSRPRPVKALVPLLEFMPLVSQDGSIVDVIDAEDGRLDMVSFKLSRSFEKDSHVVRAIPGCWNSQCLLLNHGVLPAKVDFEYMPLSLLEGDEIAYAELLEQYCEEEDTSDDVLKQKVDIMSQAGLGEVAVSHGGNVHMLAAFRVLVMTPEEVEKTLSGDVDLSVVVSVENEGRVTQVLSEMLYHTFSAYGTSLAEDKALLDTLEDSEVSTAVTMRTREKSLLLSVLQMLFKARPASVYVPAVHLILRESL